MRCIGASPNTLIHNFEIQNSLKKNKLLFVLGDLAQIHLVAKFELN